MFSSPQHCQQDSFRHIFAVKLASGSYLLSSLPSPYIHQTAAFHATRYYSPALSVPVPVVACLASRSVRHSPPGPPSAPFVPFLCLCSRAHHKFVSPYVSLDRSHILASLAYPPIFRRTHLLSLPVLSHVTFLLSHRPPRRTQFSSVFFSYMYSLPL